MQPLYFYGEAFDSQQLPVLYEINGSWLYSWDVCDYPSRFLGRKQSERRRRQVLKRRMGWKSIHWIQQSLKFAPSNQLPAWAG